MHSSAFRGLVDLGRLELPTSRLSGVRSNLLSYRSIYLFFFRIALSLLIQPILIYLSIFRVVFNHASRSAKKALRILDDNSFRIALSLLIQPILIYLSIFRVVFNRASRSAKKVLRFLKDKLNFSYLLRYLFKQHSTAIPYAP